MSKNIKSLIKKKGDRMKAEDHFQKALRLDEAQSQLDPAHYSELIIEGCYMAAHHYIERAQNGEAFRTRKPTRTKTMRACSNRRMRQMRFGSPGEPLRPCAQVGFTAKNQMNQRERKRGPLCRLSRAGPKRCALIHRESKVATPNCQETVMKKRIGQKRARLYLREYPYLLRQIRRLVELVRAQDPNVALLVLFGSTARLEPGPYSDSDLLILLYNPRVIYEPDKTAKIIRLIGEQAGATLPPTLTRLQPFDAWLERVNGLLAQCEQVLASRTLPRDIPA
jgi:predicted nucleotidyltransferase